MDKVMWGLGKLKDHLDKHAPPDWQRDDELSSLFKSLSLRAPFSAVVLDLDIRNSTALLKEAHDFYGFGLDLANFFDVMKREVHGHKGCFDKFLGDGCIGYWPHAAGDKQQFERAISRAYLSARNAIRSFREIQLPKFRLLVRNMPCGVGLSAGMDAGELYFAIIAGDLTILGLPVVGAVRMLENAQPGEIVANAKIGGFVTHRRLEVNSIGNWLGIGEVDATERPQDLRSRESHPSVLRAKRESRPTKEYPQGQDKYLLSEAAADPGVAEMEQEVEGRPAMVKKKTGYADEGLPVVWFWRQLNSLTKKVRSDNIFGWFLKKAGCPEESAKGKRRVFVDVCILVFLALAAAALALWDYVPWFHTAAAVIVIVRLADITNVLLVGDITPNRQRDGKLRKFVSSRWRYMLHTMLTVAQVVVGFAVLFRYFGEQFVYEAGGGVTRGIEDGLTALYQSFLTLTTLGYGEIHPDPGCWQGKAIVVWELALFIILLVVRMPMAIGLSYVKPEDETGIEGWEKYPAGS